MIRWFLCRVGFHFGADFETEGGIVYRLCIWCGKRA